MHTMKTTRRLLLALLVTVASLVSANASADIAPPPTLMHIVGQSAVTSGAPDHATFELENVGPGPIEVYLYRAILREGTRYPLTITRAEIDGREVGRRVTVPARSTVRVTVFFDVPDAFESRGRWDIELRVTTDGFGATDSRPASITRGRDGARKWAAPKSR
ncbi:MAG: hypothetical protein H6719_38560 [Sandaracinaceae bacterium]|nr:hypothetical protein [Sandaracinaceae bacterium]